MSIVYRRVPTSKTNPPVKEVGPVLHFPWVKGQEPVEFLCPCGHRTVFVTTPPHGIAFDAEERLTITGSIGARAKGTPGEPEYKPPNWCHFYIETGIPRMCEDAICPGNAS